MSEFFTTTREMRDALAELLNVRAEHTRLKMAEPYEDEDDPDDLADVDYLARANCEPGPSSMTMHMRNGQRFTLTVKREDE